MVKFCIHKKVSGAWVNKTTGTEEWGGGEEREATGECINSLASYGGLFLIPLLACRHSSSITGRHGGYVAASSSSALCHSATRWDLNGMLHSERDGQTGSQRGCHTDRKVAELFNPSGWKWDATMGAQVHEILFTDWETQRREKNVRCVFYFICVLIRMCPIKLSKVIYVMIENSE